MTLEKSNTDKLAELSDEARRLNGRVEPPSIQRSGVDFEVHRNSSGGRCIRYALGAIKGVGEGHAEAVVSARGEKPFRDLADFAERIDPGGVNKRMLESLAAAGAFDELAPDRASVFSAIESILAYAHRRDEERRAGQSALFGDGADADLPLPKAKPWTLAERLQREFDSVGFFLSGHPLDAYAAILNRLRVQRWTEFVRAVKLGASAGRLAATVLDRQERRTKSGSKMGVVQLSDSSGQYEAILFQEGLNQYRDLLEKGASLLLSLQASVEGEDIRARIVSAEPLDLAATRVQKGLRIFVSDEKPLLEIKRTLRPNGDGEVALVLQTASGEVELKLPGKYLVSAQAAGLLKAIPGIVAVEHV